MNILKIPKFLYRFPSVPSKKEMEKLEEKVINRFIQGYYTKLLAQNNIFYLYSWIPESTEKVDRNHFWKEFNVGQPKVNSYLWLPKKLDTSMLQKCIGLDFIRSNNELRCIFQTIDNLGESKIQGNSKLSLFGVGIRLNTDRFETLQYIEPLLEESNNLYKNLNYKKLLDIARRNREIKTVSNSSKQSAKLFLNQLAQKKLLIPLVSPDMNWLLFTKESR